MTVTEQGRPNPRGEAMVAELKGRDMMVARFAELLGVPAGAGPAGAGQAGAGQAGDAGAGPAGR